MDSQNHVMEEGPQEGRNGLARPSVVAPVQTRRTPRKVWPWQLTMEISPAAY